MLGHTPIQNQPRHPERPTYGQQAVHLALLDLSDVEPDPVGAIAQRVRMPRTQVRRAISDLRMGGAA